MCPAGYGGDICDKLVQERMIQVAPSTYYMLALVAILVTGKKSNYVA